MKEKKAIKDLLMHGHFKKQAYWARLENNILYTINCSERVKSILKHVFMFLLWTKINETISMLWISILHIYWSLFLSFTFLATHFLSLFSFATSRKQSICLHLFQTIKILFLYITFLCVNRDWQLSRENFVNLSKRSCGRCCGHTSLNLFQVTIATHTTRGGHLSWRKCRTMN